MFENEKMWTFIDEKIGIEIVDFFVSFASLKGSVSMT